MYEIRGYVLNHGRLPNDITERVYKDKSLRQKQQDWLLFLLYETAANWEPWSCKKDRFTRPGFREILECIDEEHYDPNPAEFGHGPGFWTMPIFPSKESLLDWRKVATDTNPVDVSWSPEDIKKLGDSFDEEAFA